MRIETIKVDRGNKRTVHGPILRVSLAGSGCPLPGCNCSPPYYLCVSDGETWIKVELTAEEAAHVREGGPVDITQD